MSELAHIAALIFKRAAGRDRILVAIAGPPGSGKSTLAEALCDALVAGGQSAAVVAMDGFHFDDRVLEARGLRARKGAPETFDAGGLAHLLRRLREREADVAVPVFDRSIEIARAGGAVIASDARIVLVEGNYLLLDEEPWSAMAPLFDMSIYLDVPAGELEAFRISKSVPLWGSELTEGLLAPEANLEATDISYHKGCYIGQEVISRIKSAGKVNRSLVKLEIPEDVPVKADDGLVSEGSDAGVVTSVSPVADGGVREALAYVKRSADRSDLRVAVDGELYPVRVGG